MFICEMSNREKKALMYIILFLSSSYFVCLFLPFNELIFERELSILFIEKVMLSN